MGQESLDQIVEQCAGLAYAVLVYHPTNALCRVNNTINRKGHIVFTEFLGKVTCCST